MKKTVTEWFCDTCGTKEKVCTYEVQVIFTTEQNEGKPVKPYLQINKVDLCAPCYAYILKGNALWAHGAQGINHYYFKPECSEVRDEVLSEANK